MMQVTYDVDTSKTFDRKTYVCCTTAFRRKYGSFEYHTMRVATPLNSIPYVTLTSGSKAGIIRNLFEKILSNGYHNYKFLQMILSGSFITTCIQSACR